MIIFLVILGILLSVTSQKKKEILVGLADPKRKKLDEIGSINVFTIGQYLTGLPKLNQSELLLECAITKTDFVFLVMGGVTNGKYVPFPPEAATTFSIQERGAAYKELGYREVDRIPRDSINQVIVDDKSKITQRLTVIRMVTLGVFSLAAPQTVRHQQFCLVVDWNDEKGVRQNTVFEFSGIDAKSRANEAANMLSKSALSKPERTKPDEAKVEGMRIDERKCPYCAETIKAAAIICRFCNRDLAADENLQ
jgi:hypothetical protein